MNNNLDGVLLWIAYVPIGIIPIGVFLIFNSISKLEAYSARNKIAPNKQEMSRIYAVVGFPILMGTLAAGFGIGISYTILKYRQGENIGTFGAGMGFLAMFLFLSWAIEEVKKTFKDLKTMPRNEKKTKTQIVGDQLVIQKKLHADDKMEKKLVKGKYIAAYTSKEIYK